MLFSLSTYGYIFLFFYSLGGGMVAVIAAGVLSYADKMDLALSIGLAALANFIGDTILFYLGRYNKKAIMPYFSKHKRKLALCQILMKKYGDKIIFIKKFIYGLKTLVPIAVGLTKYSFVKFSVINAVSAIIWAVGLGMLSFYAGEFVMNAGLYIGERSWIMPAVMFSLLGLIWYYLNKFSKKRNTRSHISPF
jgi:integral membrane protein